MREEKIMNNEEFEGKRNELTLEQLRVETDSQKRVNDLDCVSIVQERIRRNIETCVSVVKVSDMCKCKDLTDEALTKISELMKALTA